MPQITHRTDPDTGALVQVVSPAELRRVLLADGETLDRPAHLDPADEWDTGENTESDDAAAAAIDLTDPDYLAWVERDKERRDRTPTR